MSIDSSGGSADSIRSLQTYSMKEGKAVENDKNDENKQITSLSNNAISFKRVRPKWNKAKRSFVEMKQNVFVKQSELFAKISEITNQDPRFLTSRSTEELDKIQKSFVNICKKTVGEGKTSKRNKELAVTEQLGEKIGAIKTVRNSEAGKDARIDALRKVSQHLVSGDRLKPQGGDPRRMPGTQSLKELTSIFNEGDLSEGSREVVRGFLDSLPKNILTLDEPHFLRKVLSSKDIPVTRHSINPTSLKMEERRIRQEEITPLKRQIDDKKTEKGQVSHDTHMNPLHRKSVIESSRKKLKSDVERIEKKIGRLPQQFTETHSAIDRLRNLKKTFNDTECLEDIGDIIEELNEFLAPPIPSDAIAYDKLEAVGNSVLNRINSSTKTIDRFLNVNWEQNRQNVKKTKAQQQEAVAKRREAEANRDVPPKDQLRRAKLGLEGALRKATKIDLSSRNGMGSKGLINFAKRQGYDMAQLREHSDIGPWIKEVERTEKLVEEQG